MSLTRREAVLGGALTILWGLRPCRAHGNRGRHGFGCVLEADEAQPFLATAVASRGGSRGSDEELITNTGNRDFDYALAQTLSRLTDIYGVLPGFGFYDDYDGENAYATTVRKMQRADGTVLYGKRYFLSGMGQGEAPDAVIAAVCAHEFGHIVQFKHNLMGRLNAGQRTVKRSELHADFFSGYFAGMRKLRKPDYAAAVYATTAFSIGDDDVTDPDHHGTSEERAAAVVRGFDTAYRERKSFADAIQIGVNYVSRL